MYGTEASECQFHLQRCAQTSVPVCSWRTNRGCSRIMRPFVVGGLIPQQTQKNFRSDEARRGETSRAADVQLSFSGVPWAAFRFVRGERIESGREPHMRSLSAG